MTSRYVEVPDGRGHLGFTAKVTGSASLPRGLHVRRLDTGERTFVARATWPKLWRLIPKEDSRG